MGKYVALNDEIHAYMSAQRSHAQDPVVAALLAETKNLGEVSGMAISPEQGSFMTLLVAAVNAKWAVEIGTFTGLSALSIARGLIPGGRLTCFERDFRWTSIARRYWMRAGVQDRIDLRLGDAAALLAHFRPSSQLDFVFIDADKESYDTYYELTLPLVRVGGLIVFDNMLRNGELVDPSKRHSAPNRAVDALNRKLAADMRVQSVLIPIADGLHICRKLPRGGRPSESHSL
ncbi:MAG: class I SAM-dependent methyltransferase [Methylacidiphilales bacterium]|nr:class I SAM-dependent methyltransferase [Candidatus Methylacidiphilales bacterium]